MASLNELKLKDDVLEETAEVDFDKIPEFGGFVEPPQPGAYRMKLPAAQALATAWETVETAKYGTRVQVIFSQDAPLTIVQSPNAAKNGEPFTTRLSNVPRPRGKDKVLVSDLDLLLRAMGVEHRPKTNSGYIQALNALAGKEFGGDIEWSWNCNPQRSIYVPSDDGQSSVEVPEVKGCGARYYQKDVKGLVTEGMYPLRITCSGTRQEGEQQVACGALIRGFANLGNFRK